eukprot:6319791-Heterocapsa_arctica.AAC.1
MRYRRCQAPPVLQLAMAGVAVAGVAVAGVAAARGAHEVERRRGRRQDRSPTGPRLLWPPGRGVAALAAETPPQKPVFGRDTAAQRVLLHVRRFSTALCGRWSVLRLVLAGVAAARGAHDTCSRLTLGSVFSKRSNASLRAL